MDMMLDLKGCLWVKSIVMFGYSYSLTLLMVLVYLVSIVLHLRPKFMFFFPEEHVTLNELITSSVQYLVSFYFIFLDIDLSLFSLICTIFLTFNVLLLKSL